MKNDVFEKCEHSIRDSAEERVASIYSSAGGPLVGWLLDECKQRGQLPGDMAQELGVTSGYINQLRSGLRKSENISREFAVSCARYLGVPPVVVMIVSGRISMQDFVCPTQPPEPVLQRAFNAMLEDPVVRALLPADVGHLNADARQALVRLNGNTTGHDVRGCESCPRRCAGCKEQLLYMTNLRVWRSVATATSPASLLMASESFIYIGQPNSGLAS